MGGTRPEREQQGKHGLLRNCLRMKPLVFAAALLVAAGAFAQEPRIRRCIGADGEPVFTDRPCATPMPTAPVQSERRPGEAGTPAWVPDVATRTCPTSADELRNRVIGAFNARNAMTLSGLFLWEGRGTASASSQLQHLARLIAEPLVAIELDSAGMHDDAFGLPPSARERSDTRLTIRSVRGTDRVPHEAVSEYGLTSRNGCWWLVLPY